MKPDRETIYQILEEITEYEGLASEPQTELAESNILDSLSFILFLDRMDTEFGVELQPTQIPYGVWRTPQSLADFILQMS